MKADKKFTVMKISIQNPEHSVKVRQILRDEGYDFAGLQWDYPVFARAGYLYTYKTGLVMRGDVGCSAYFLNHPNEEYVLVNDNFVKVSEWFVQPKTKVDTSHLLYRWDNKPTGEVKLSFVQTGEAEYTAKYELVVTVPFVQPTAPFVAPNAVDRLKINWFDTGDNKSVELPPKEEHQRQRKIDILRAMLSKLENKDVVPDVWQEELNDLFWQEQHRKQFVEDIVE